MFFEPSSATRRSIFPYFNKEEDSASEASTGSLDEKIVNLGMIKYPTKFFTLGYFKYSQIKIVSFKSKYVFL